MEKKYKPSKKRMLRARQEGNLPKSQYLSQVAGFLVGGLAVFYLIEISWVNNKILLEYLWSEGLRDPSVAFQKVLYALTKFLFFLLLPFVIGGVFAELWQVGFSIEGSLMLPAFKRIEPVSGSRKIVQGLRDLWLLVVKLLALLLVFYWFLRGIVYKLYQQVNSSPIVDGSFIEDTLWQAWWYGAFILIPLMVLDYFVRYKRWFQQMGMSLQDLRDEHKQEEGDPMIKGSRRALHEALLREDLITRVRKSKVIIVEKKADCIK